MSPHILSRLQNSALLGSEHLVLSLSHCDVRPWDEAALWQDLPFLLLIPDSLLEVLLVNDGSNLSAGGPEGSLLGCPSRPQAEPGMVAHSCNPAYPVSKSGEDRGKTPCRTQLALILVLSQKPSEST